MNIKNLQDVQCFKFCKISQSYAEELSLSREYVFKTVVSDNGWGGTSTIKVSAQKLEKTNLWEAEVSVECSIDS